MPEIKVQHQCASKDDLVLTESLTRSGTKKIRPS